MELEKTPFTENMEIKKLSSELLLKTLSSRKSEASQTVRGKQSHH